LESARGGDEEQVGCTEGIVGGKDETTVIEAALEYIFSGPLKSKVPLEKVVLLMIDEDVGSKACVLPEDER